MNPNRFFLNSDYTSEKIAGVYSIEIAVPSASIPSYGQKTYSKEIVVPKGVFFEDIFYNLSLKPNDSTYGSFLYYVKNSPKRYDIYALTYRSSENKYKLDVWVDSGESSTITVPSFTITAKLHLSVAP